jgi:predicted ester cyclase
LQYTVEDQIAQGDTVVTRWTLHGTHLGEFMGIPATAKPVNVTGIQVERIIDRKITEHWRQSDDLGLMYQLGVIPGPGQS